MKNMSGANQPANEKTRFGGFSFIHITTKKPGINSGLSFLKIISVQTHSTQGSLRWGGHEDFQ